LLSLFRVPEHDVCKLFPVDLPVFLQHLVPESGSNVLPGRFPGLDDLLAMTS
jgi:hypothetical protein